MLGIRLDDELDQKLTAIARQRGLTKSELVREAIRRYLSEDELASEARRQSLLVSAHEGEAETLEFIEAVSDLDDWQ
jgi:RHH-type rel operon transcriptional repressor/antitoxin RelB